MDKWQTNVNQTNTIIFYLLFSHKSGTSYFDWQDIINSNVVYNNRLMSVQKITFKPRNWQLELYISKPSSFSPPLFSSLSHSCLLTSCMFTHNSVKMPLHCTSCAAIKYTWQKEREKEREDREKEWEKWMIYEAVRLKAVHERFPPYWRR